MGYTAKRCGEGLVTGGLGPEPLVGLTYGFLVPEPPPLGETPRGFLAPLEFLEYGLGFLDPDCTALGVRLLTGV